MVGQSATRRWGGGAWGAALLTCGVLHCVTFTAFAASGVDGHFAEAESLGVGPLSALTLAVAVVTLIRFSGAVRLPPVWITVAYAATLLVPSSTLAVVATAAYAALIAVLSAAPARYAAACIAGLAAVQCWMSLGQHGLAPPLLQLDARAAAHVLALFQPGVRQFGNVVQSGGGHFIVMFIGCGTVFILPPAILAAAMLALRDAPRLGLAHVRAILGLAAVMAVCNICRLAWLASSRDAYAVGHGVVGLNLFDALIVGLVFLAAGLARRKLAPASVPPGRPAPAPAWLLAALAVACIGLAPKIVRYSVARSPVQHAAETAMTRFFGESGWQLSQRRRLIRNADYALLTFTHPGCDSPVSVVMLTGDGVASATAGRALGGSFDYLDAGELTSAPAFTSPMRFALATTLNSMGLTRSRPMPLFAVAPPPPAQPSACAPPAAARWRQLASIPD